MKRALYVLAFLGATLAIADVTVIGPSVPTTAPFVGGIDVVSGHVKASGTAPVVSACGTSPSAVIGSDSAGTLTTGSGVNTTCTLTFATAYGTAPACMVSSTFIQAMAAATTTTTLIITASDLSSKVVAYHCLEGS